MLEPTEMINIELHMDNLEEIKKCHIGWSEHKHERFLLHCLTGTSAPRELFTFGSLDSNEYMPKWTHYTHET